MTVENIKYHLKIIGEGKPAVCLHGFSENWCTWDFIRIEGYQMILFDLVGHGESDKPFPGKAYYWKNIVKHLHRLIQQLDLKKYSLLGYSMGGRIALAYALAYSGEIDKLILESTSYGECGWINRFQRRRKDAKLAKSIRRNGVEWFNRYWSGLGLFATQAQLSQDVIEQISARRLMNRTHALANTLHGSGQGTFPCLKHQISGLSMPVLYISGEYDMKYGQAGLEFRKLNPKIKHEIIKGVGHNTHIEDPQAFKKIIKKFLDKERT
ncbi:MAG: Proline iminopeptidase [Candidatus Dichloromethanomonas elyunquensis]|nr:MAG: Proline iminopeptidase [Candidatus Dichloromethanomonas elyunquensis]